MRALAIAALVGALSTTAATAVAQVSPAEAEAAARRAWTAKCQADVCLLTVDIVHGDPAGKPQTLKVSVAAHRSGSGADFVSFGLPAQANKGHTFAIGFADTEKDANGAWTVKMVSGSTRVLNVSDCTSDRCLVTLPRGVVPADGEAGELDVADNMLKHRLLLMFYFEGPERVRVSTPLFAFQEAYGSLPGVVRR